MYNFLHAHKILEGETEASFSTLATTTKMKLMNLQYYNQPAFAICLIYIWMRV